MLPALLAVGDYAVVALLIGIVVGLSAVIMILTHLIGPKRTGPIKDTPYESGVDPIGDSRKRFNVRFYIVAMLFLLFDVEIVFFYPWATLFPRFHVPSYSEWAARMQAASYGPAYFLLEMLVFFIILLAGYVYAWRKGVFKWD